MFSRLKRNLCGAVNGIFAKLGRLASEDVLLQLICQKCMSVLLYGLEVCLLSKMKTFVSGLYTVNRVLMKLFRIFNIDVIEDCIEMYLASNYPVYG